MASVTEVKFEHYHPENTLGVQESRPRLSWKISNAPSDFEQAGYEVELNDKRHGAWSLHSSVQRTSRDSTLVPWPFNPLASREEISVRVRVWENDRNMSDWSSPSYLEVGLLDRSDWKCERITAPWAGKTSDPEPEHLYTKFLSVQAPVQRARLYVTAQGVYEVEINGRRVGDYFMAPGWTTYSHRLQYQTYDVTPFLGSGVNCLGTRVAEGWFCGRIGFEGGHRNIWGPHPALMAQLEITYTDGSFDRICTGHDWMVKPGPIRLAEIYDGEKYDARLEDTDWSSYHPERTSRSIFWKSAALMRPLPDSIKLTAGYGEPVRRVEVIKPVETILTPSGKTIIDFGQNLVGYLRLKKIKGPRGHKITLTHAEVLENGELGIRPLRICKAMDEYTLKGDEAGESYEPRFTFHGFRYAEIQNWPGKLDLSTIEAVVCHTDMKPAGSFSCSEPLLNKLYDNIVWGMRGNFLSVPTDCPQVSFTLLMNWLP